MQDMQYMQDTQNKTMCVCAYIHIVYLLQLLDMFYIESRELSLIRKGLI